jgi:hypothetical protein
MTSSGHMQQGTTPVWCLAKSFCFHCWVSKIDPKIYIQFVGDSKWFQTRVGKYFPALDLLIFDHQVAPVSMRIALLATWQPKFA